MRRVGLSAIVVALACVLLDQQSHADDPPEVDAIVQKAVKAVGGKEKLLRLFRFKEIYHLGKAEKGTTRVSVMEPPAHWWLGKNDRSKDTPPEPATLLVWCWTLAPLVDPDVKRTLLKETTEGDKVLVGLKLSGKMKPDMDVYFDKASGLLARIDWRGAKYLFDDWKEVDGVKYAASCVATRGKGEPYVRTVITEVERLKELPKGLSRD